MRPDVWAQGVNMSRASFYVALTCERRGCPQLDNFLRFSIIDGPMFLEIGGRTALEWFRNVSCCLAVTSFSRFKITCADPNDYVFVLGRAGASAAAALLQQVCAATLTFQRPTLSNFNTGIKFNVTAVTFSRTQ